MEPDGMAWTFARLFFSTTGSEGPCGSLPNRRATARPMSQAVPTVLAHTRGRGCSDSVARNSIATLPMLSVLSGARKLSFVFLRNSRFGHVLMQLDEKWSFFEHLCHGYPCHSKRSSASSAAMIVYFLLGLSIRRLNPLALPPAARVCLDCHL